MNDTIVLVENVLEPILGFRQSTDRSPRIGLVRGGNTVLRAGCLLAAYAAHKGLKPFVVDGGNRFDPFAVSLYARRHGLDERALLQNIMVSRGFTCYQVANLVTEKLARVGEPDSVVLVLSPCATFFDESVTTREATMLFDRTVKGLRYLSRRFPFVLLQPLPCPNPRRRYLLTRLHRACDTSLVLHGGRIKVEKPKDRCRNAIRDRSYESER